MKAYLFIFTLLSLPAMAATNKIEKVTQFEHANLGLIKEVVFKNPRVLDRKIWSESNRDGVCKAIAAQVEIPGFKNVTSKEMGHSEYWMTFTNSISPKDYVEVDSNGIVKNSISNQERHIKRLNCYFKEI